MLATAAIVAMTTGKNEAMKIKKIEGISPMPNHRMAKGIQASGERLRKKLTAGKQRSPSAAAVSEDQTKRKPKRHREREARGNAKERRHNVVEQTSALYFFHKSPRNSKRRRESGLREDTQI